jgi:hypothetical protein
VACLIFLDAATLDSLTNILYPTRSYRRVAVFGGFNAVSALSHMGAVWLLVWCLNPDSTATPGQALGWAIAYFLLQLAYTGLVMLWWFAQAEAHRHRPRFWKWAMAVAVALEIAVGVAFAVLVHNKPDANFATFTGLWAVWLIVPWFRSAMVLNGSDDHLAAFAVSEIVPELIQLAWCLARRLALFDSLRRLQGGRRRRRARTDVLGAPAQRAPRTRRRRLRTRAAA